jgi:hypothetical protein
MNTLALIQKNLKHQQKVEAYNRSIAYRGVSYNPGCNKSDETHGTFVYRGHTYNK